MGCGSSRDAELWRMYREPSEFDTCSTIISSRDNRGEPDGTDDDPEVKGTYLTRGRGQVVTCVTLSLVDRKNFHPVFLFFFEFVLRIDGSNINKFNYFSRI